MEESGMDEKNEPTVEQSLGLLSEALGKAAADLCSVREAVDLARKDMSSHNGSHSREIIRDAERAVVHLRETEESLKDVLKDLVDTD
jgi:cob(I)alamin adenosyltransferase